MFEEFQDILNTPRESPSHVLTKMQALMIGSMQQLLPSSFDFSFISSIYQQEIGPQNALKINLGQPVSLTVEEQIFINFKIFEHFVPALKYYYINPEIYQALQQQTQKAEATIRSHIKVEQEMKMYLDYLESKIFRYEKQLKGFMKEVGKKRKEFELLKIRQSVLYREKVNLIKRNGDLDSELGLLMESIKSSEKWKIKLANKGKIFKIVQNLKKKGEEKYDDRSFSSETTPRQRNKEHYSHKENKNNLTKKKSSSYLSSSR